MRFLLSGRRRDRIDLVIALIPFRGHPFDDPALPRRVPAFEHDDRGTMVDDMRDLNMLQLFLKIAQVMLVMMLVFLAALEIRQVDRHGLAP